MIREARGGYPCDLDKMNREVKKSYDDALTSYLERHCKPAREAKMSEIRTEKRKAIKAVLDACGIIPSPKTLGIYP